MALPLAAWSTAICAEAPIASGPGVALMGEKGRCWRWCQLLYLPRHEFLIFCRSRERIIHIRFVGLSAGAKHGNRHV
jgi:hypothetical protein